MSMIEQCEVCRRYFVGGEVVSVSIGDGLAAAREGRMGMFRCVASDCKDVAARNLENDRAGQRRDCRRRAAFGSSRPVRKAAGLPPARTVLGSCPEDTEVSEDAPQVAREIVTEPRTQREFEDSGAAANQNASLVAFFSDPRTHGKMFPMVYLEEISGSKRMNNRAIDLRAHFKPLGFGIWNEMRQAAGRGPCSSHYGLFPLAEVERRERERDADRERRRLEKVGQKELV